MGARWLKAEETEIRVQYPTARRWNILKHIPGRTWIQISVKARKMGIHRTKEAKGESIREGRMLLKKTYEFSENMLFDRIYPTATHAELLKAFPNRTFSAIISHAQRRHLHRTREAKARQIQIGRRNAKKEKRKCLLTDHKLTIAPQDPGEPPAWCPTPPGQQIFWVDRKVFDTLLKRRYDKPCDICPAEVKKRCDETAQRSEKK